MRKTMPLYLTSVAGFGAAMALLAYEEDNPQVRRGKLRACALVPIWPLYALAGAASVYERRRAPLLPDDAYPPDPATGAPMGEKSRRRLDARLRAMLSELPTVPGTYWDSQGDPWVLDDEGGWTDHTGQRRDARYAPIIVALLHNDGSIPAKKESGR